MTKNLKKYQEVDGQIKRIVDGINRSEEAKSSKKLGHFLKDAEESIKKMEVRAKDLTVSYTKLSERFAESTASLADLEEGVGHALDKDELNYISKKLAEASKNVNVVERELATVQKEMEEIISKYDSLRAKVPTAQKRYSEARAVVNGMKKEKESEIAALKKEIEALEKEIDPATIEAYRRLRSQGTFPVYVPLSGGNKCGGCQMEIPSGVITKITEDHYITCENCGRMVGQ